jgi:penicillin-binding protein 1A
MSNDYRSREERRKAQTKKKNQPKKKRGLFKKIVIATLLFFLLIVIGGGIAVFAIIQNTPELEPGLLETPQSTTIYDKNDEEVATMFNEQNRVKVDIENVPKTVQDAFTSIEDSRFRDHFGIDVRRVFGAVLANFREGFGSEGASTITQQLIKSTVLSPEKTLTRKIKEAYLAIQLEQKYTKDQILEMYMNTIYFGKGNIYGIATAAERYYGKQVQDLELHEAAMLAGLVNGPGIYNPIDNPEKAKERRNLVLRFMVENDAITKEEAKKAKSVPVQKTLVEQNNQKEESYDAFVDQVFQELVNDRKIIGEKEFFQGGLEIYTTLDKDAQTKVENILSSNEIPYPDEYFETGIALIDTQSGAVRAIGGGRDFVAAGKGYTNYGARAQQQTGSTIKPVLDYGPVIENKQWSTYHQLVDKPHKYSTGEEVGEWDGEYWGEMTMRRALAWSRNIPAVKALQAVGTEKAGQFAKNLGIEVADPLYESAALGSDLAKAAPLEMAGAYAAFGNGGVYNEPYTVRKIEFPGGQTKDIDHEPEVAMHDYTAYMITDMLKTVVHSGTGTAADISGLPLAGKTGSTQIPDDMIEQYGIQENGIMDSWFTGYTTQYAASVWTGYMKNEDEDGNPLFIRYDGSDDIAKQIFKELMSSVSSSDTPDFKQPDSVVELAIEKGTGLRASEYTPEDKVIYELFVKDNAPSEVSDKYQKPDAPKGLKAKYDKKANMIKLTWRYPEEENIAFDIEVSVGDQSFQKLGTTEKTEVVIENTAPDSVYKFKVTAFDTENGNRSDPAEAQVKTPKEKPDKKEKDDDKKDEGNGNGQGNGNNNGNDDQTDDGTDDGTSGGTDDGAGNETDDGTNETGDEADDGSEDNPVDDNPVDELLNQ